MRTNPAYEEEFYSEADYYEREAMQAEYDEWYEQAYREWLLEQEAKALYDDEDEEITR